MQYSFSTFSMHADMSVRASFNERVPLTDTTMAFFGLSMQIEKGTLYVCNSICMCMHVCVVGVITIINTEFYRITRIGTVPYHFHNLHRQYRPLSDESAAE